MVPKSLCHWEVSKGQATNRPSFPDGSPFTNYNIMVSDISIFTLLWQQTPFFVGKKKKASHRKLDDPSPDMDGRSEAFNIPLSDTIVKQFRDRFWDGSAQAEWLIKEWIDNNCQTKRNITSRWLYSLAYRRSVSVVIRWARLYYWPVQAAISYHSDWGKGGGERRRQRRKTVRSEEEEEEEHDKRRSIKR